VSGTQATGEELRSYFASLSWLVVYPALAAAAERAGIAGTLGRLFS